MIVICAVSESLSTILNGGRGGRRNSPASVEQVKRDLLIPGLEVGRLTTAPAATGAFSEFFGPL